MGTIYCSQMQNQAIETPLHFLEDKAVTRSLTPTKYRKYMQRVSDDSDDPIQDLLDSQIEYTWNESDLESRAIAFAKLNGKKNTNCQTVERAFRRHVNSQAYFRCDQTSNTCIDKASSASATPFPFLRHARSYKHGM